MLVYLLCVLLTQPRRNGDLAPHARLWYPRTLPSPTRSHAGETSILRPRRVRAPQAKAHRGHRLAEARASPRQVFRLAHSSMVHHSRTHLCFSRTSSGRDAIADPPRRCTLALLGEGRVVRAGNRPVRSPPSHPTCPRLGSTTQSPWQLSARRQSCPRRKCRSSTCGSPQAGVG